MKRGSSTQRRLRLGDVVDAAAPVVGVYSELRRRVALKMGLSHEVRMLLEALRFNGSLHFRIRKGEVVGSGIRETFRG